VLVVHPSVPAKSTQELVALARSKPGTLNFASLGAATTQGLAASMFNFMTGIDAVQIAYKGSAPGVADVLAGNVQFMFNALPSMLQHVQAGKLRALGTTGAKRAPQLPDVPTVSEAVPGYEVTTWYSVVAPAGTPRPIVNRLNAILTAYVNRPDTQDRMNALAITPLTSTPDELAAFIPAEIKRWAQVVKDAGITPQ